MDRGLYLNKRTTLPTKRLLLDLQKQWKDELHTDITIFVGKKRFNCHSCVIRAVSSYLKSLCLKDKDINLSEYPEPHHLDVLISKLYTFEQVSVETFKTKILPVAKYLKIEFITKIPETTRDSAKLNDLMDLSWRKLFYDEISDIRKTGNHHDIKLKVEERVFQCHKAILAACSMYFDKMFQSGMKEASEEETVQHGLDKDTMEFILDFIYLGKDILTVLNIQSVLSASVYLQIPSLQKSCEKFLIQHLDSENFLDVLMLADTFSCDALEIGVKAYILRHFDEMSKTKVLLSLNKNQLIDIISNNNLNVSDEFTVLHVVLQWFDNDLDRTETDFEETMKHVRCKDIRDNILDARVHKTLDSLIQSNVKNRNKSDCKQIVKKILLLDPKDNKELFERNQEVMLVLFASSEINGVYLGCYSFMFKRWYKLKSMPSYKAGCSYAACCTDDMLYLSGGSGTPNGFICYKGQINQWISLEKLAKQRSDHVTVFANESVYVIGGSKPILMEILSDISRYSLSEKSWCSEGQLTIPVSNSACAVLDQKILIFGGNMSFVQHSNHIQCFDMITKSCCVISRLPMICSFTGITQINDAFYIICPQGQVIRYVPDEDPETIGKVHNSCLTGFAVVGYNEKVLVLGGCAPKYRSEQVKVFDVATRIPSTHSSLFLPWRKCSNQYYGTMFWINKSYLNKPYPVS